MSSVLELIHRSVCQTMPGADSSQSIPGAHSLPNCAAAVVIGQAADGTAQKWLILVQTEIPASVEARAKNRRSAWQRSSGLSLRLRSLSLPDPKVCQGVPTAALTPVLPLGCRTLVRLFRDLTERAGSGCLSRRGWHCDLRAEARS
jgi:hypothetical protein